MANDTRYDVFQHYGTNAERLAFTPAPAATIQPLYIWYETDTLNTYLYHTSWVQISSSTGGTGDVVGPGVAVDEDIVLFDGTSGKLIKDSGVKLAAFGDVVGPASAVDGNFPLFDGATGKLLKDGGVSPADFGDLSGPASAVDENIVIFDGTSGKLVKDSGLTPASITNIIQKATVTLTNTEIKALPTTPYQLVGAQGAGTRVVFLFADFALFGSTAAYTNVDTDAWSGLQIGGVDVSTYFGDSTTPSTTSAYYFYATGGDMQCSLLPLFILDIVSWASPMTSIMGNYATLQNAPLLLQVDNNGAGDFTGGNAANTLTVNVLYIVV